LIRLTGLVAAFILAALALAGAHPVDAAVAGHVTGGGEGTFSADLDGDGDVDGSHFGIGVVLLGNNAARGHFECLMAGAQDFLGLKLMAVEGKVTGGALGVGNATFSGIGSVNLANGTVFRGVPLSVTVTPGGPGVGTLTLTVIGAFDGVPGDTILGNGNYDLPPETVAAGAISIR
jgi:hypothetical protein